MNGNSAFEQAAMFGHRRPKTKILSIQTKIQTFDSDLRFL